MTNTSSPVQRKKVANTKRWQGADTKAVYRLDVGFGNGDQPHLSRDMALAEQDRNHPRIHASHNIAAEVTRYERYQPCKLKTGMHVCNDEACPACASCCLSSSSDLGRYGIGIVLYYRFIKYMVVLFAIASVFAVPNLILMHSGGKLASQLFTQVDQLALFSIGNLGEGVDVCASALDGESLAIQCPAGAAIGTVEAYYGLPSGSCGCPTAQQPSREDGECPGTVDADACTQEDAYCHLDVAREVSTPAREFTSGSCCSHQLVDSRPDFRWLSLVLPQHCSASAAQAVARGVCLGKQSCSIPATGQNITWTPGVLSDFECPAQADVLPDGSCSMGLDATGDLDTCVWPNSTLSRPEAFDVDSFSRTPPAQSWAVRRPDGTFRHFATRPTAAQMAAVGGSTAYPVSRDMQMYAPELPAPGQHRLMVVAQCFDTEVVALGEAFTKQDVGVFIGLFDVGLTLALLLGFMLLAEAERTEIRDFADVAASDYSVFMGSVPRHSDVAALEPQLRSHFTNIARQARQVDKPLTNPEIADINFALDNTEVVGLLVKRGRILKKLDLKLNLARVLTQQLQQRKAMTNRSSAAEERLSKRLASAKGSMDKLGEELARMDGVLDNKESEKHNRKALSAYITFEEEEACLRVLETYPRSTLLYFCQGFRKRFGNIAPGERVWVERAPDPSDVIWENLDVRTSKLRSACTFLITLFVLFLSGLAVFLTEDAARQAQREYTSPDCSAIPSAVFANKTNVVRDEYFEDFGLQTGRTGLLECFCLDRVDLLDPSALSNEKFQTPDGELALCVDWAQTYFTVQILTYGGAVITLFVNVILRFILKGIVQFERHRSKTSELLSRAFKMFVLQFLNTAAIVVFINARIDTSFEPLRRGEFSDFSEQWYVAVGTSIVLTMALNIVLPHLFPVVLWLLTKYRKCADRGCGCDVHRTKCITQRQLNRLYMGPKMFLDERYAQAFNVIFVCLAFSSGMPLLLPIGMLSFIVTYWVDSFLFAYVYRTPPRYSADLAKQFTALLPYALLLKLLVGFWMLSNDNIFPPSDAVQAAARDSDPGVAEGGNQVAAANEATLSRAVSFLDTASLDFGRRASEPNVLPHVLMIAALLLYLLLVKVLVLNLRRFLMGVCPCLRYGMGRCIPGLETKRTVQGKGLLNYFDAIPTDVLRRMETLPVKDALRQKLQRAVENRWKVQQDRQEQIEQYHAMLRDAAAQASSAANAHAEAEQEATVRLQEWLAAAQEAERQAALEQAEQVQAQRQLARIDERNRRLAVFRVRKEKAGWAAHNEALLACVQSREVQWRHAFKGAVLGASITEEDPLITTRIVEEFETIEEEFSEQALPQAVAANEEEDKLAAAAAKAAASPVASEGAGAAAEGGGADAPSAPENSDDEEEDEPVHEGEINPSHSRHVSTAGDADPPAPPSRTNELAKAITVEPPVLPPPTASLLSPEEEHPNPVSAEPSPAAARSSTPPPAPIAAAGGSGAANPVMSQPSGAVEEGGTKAAPPRPAPRASGGTSTRRRVSGVTRRLVQRMVETEVTERIDPWAATAVKPQPVTPADVQQQAHNAAMAHRRVAATAVTVDDIARADAERDAAAARAHAEAASQNPVLYLLHNRAFQRSLDKLPGSAAPVRYEMGAIHAPLSSSSGSSPLRSGAAGAFAPGLDSRPSASLASAAEEEVWTVTDTEDAEHGLGLDDPRLGVLQTAIGGGLQNHDDDASIAVAVEEQLQARMGSAYVPPEDGDMPVGWQDGDGGGGGALALSIPSSSPPGGMPGGVPRVDTAVSDGSSVFTEPQMAEQAMGKRGADDLRSPHAGPDAMVPEWGGGTGVPRTPRSTGRHTADAVLREANPGANTPQAQPQLLVTQSQIENTEAAARAHAAEQAAARQRAIAEDFYRRMGLNMNLKPPDAVQLELKYMRGLHSYDLHDSNDMLSKFGFDTDVPPRYKRRLNTATHKRRQLDAGLTGSLHNVTYGKMAPTKGASFAVGAARSSPSKKASVRGGQMRGSPMRPKRSQVKANMRKF